MVAPRDLASSSSLIFLPTKAEAQQRHIKCSSLVLIDGVCSGWLPPAICRYTISWELPCPHLFPTTLVLLLLGHQRHAMPWGLCTYCFFLTLTSGQKCSASFPTPLMSLSKYRLFRQTVWPLITGRRYVPQTLSPYLVLLFLTIHTITPTNFTNICICLLHYGRDNHKEDRYCLH